MPQTKEYHSHDAFLSWHAESAQFLGFCNICHRTMPRFLWKSPSLYENLPNEDMTNFYKEKRVPSISRMPRTNNIEFLIVLLLIIITKSRPEPAHTTNRFCICKTSYEMKGWPTLCLFVVKCSSNSAGTSQYDKEQNFYNNSICSAAATAYTASLPGDPNHSQSHKMYTGARAPFCVSWIMVASL